MNEENEEIYDEENDDIHHDKIYNNKFNETAPERDSIKFEVDSSKKSKMIDEQIDEQIVSDQLKSLIESHDKFKKFLTISEKTGSLPKINKSDINDMYATAIWHMEDYPKIEIFNYLTEYFDVSPEKFYESLSNTFKVDLLAELRNRGYLKKRKPLF